MTNWDNFIQLLLVIVGASGIFVYIWQERGKRRDAASLIVSQIDEFQVKLDEMSSYIVDGILSDIAFYESFSILDINYWSDYKHYFVRKMDAESYSRINKLYDYVSKLREQQILIKSFQELHFQMTQRVVIDIEAQLIMKNFNFEGDQFWNIYNKEKRKLIDIINKDVLTPYIPMQIRRTFEKMLKRYSLLEITGTDGYRMLKKISRRKR